MANLLKGRKASSNPSYEGFDLSHKVYFTSSVGHVLPIHWDFLIPGDKVDIKTAMVTRLMPMNSASPITLREHVDYYFVPLECLYSLFPSLLSDTNEDAASTLFDKNNFQDGFPLGNIEAARWQITSEAQKPVGEDRFGFDDRYRGSARLIEFFKYGHMPFNDSGEYHPEGYVQNFLLAQAYQAVWQYYFRDDKRVEFDSSYFNMDAYYNTLQIPDEVVAHKYLDLYYRPWKKDPYTLVSPSPLGGEHSLNHFASSGSDKNFQSFVKQWLVDRGQFGAFVASPSGSTGGFDSSTDVSFPNSTTQFDVQQSLQQHRIAQAIEKLSSIWMQSGKSYKEMMSNMFGVKVRDDWSKPIYIGSDTNQITVDEEVANVTTGTGDGSNFESYTDAGQITGRGYGRSNGDGVKFKAERHGILLALYSCVPDAVYSGDAVDMFNLYSKRNSFPWPSTDELGEQPLFGFEVSDAWGIDSSVIRGWLPRFHELKLKEDRAFGAFRHSLAFWMPFRDTQGSGMFSRWQDFYIRPTYLNNIMLEEYTIDVNLDDEEYDRFQDDPMMHFFYVEEHKASKMSSFGVPKTYFG